MSICVQLKSVGERMREELDRVSLPVKSWQEAIGFPTIVYVVMRKYEYEDDEKEAKSLLAFTNEEKAHLYVDKLTEGLKRLISLQLSRDDYVSFNCDEEFKSYNKDFYEKKSAVLYGLLNLDDFSFLEDAITWFPSCVVLETEFYIEEIKLIYRGD